mgnify:FL=1
MKRIFFIVLISLIACDNNSSQKIDIASISIDEFSVILEEVHVAEATYQLNKISDLKSAEKGLLQAYARIFKENNTTKSEFKRNLKYYSKNLEELDKVYEKILESLKEIQSNL